MKKYLVLLFLTPSLLLISQNNRLTAKDNTLGIADSIVKQQVEYKDPGSEGHDLTWDFSMLNPIKEEYTLKYFLPNKETPNRICGMEHNTRYYYNQENDSLWLTGYENSTTFMEYLVPELRLRFPLTYGDTLYSNFEGKGQYCHRTELSVKGNTRVNVDAEGELLLPENVKEKHALRVHTIRKFTEIGKDSLEMTMDIYSWYVNGMRYPIFETIKSDVIKNDKDSTIYTTSFYYSSIKQNRQLKKDEFVLEESTIDTETGPIGIDAIFTEAQFLPNPVVDNLHINFKLTRTANVWFSIQSNGGVVICQTSPTAYNEGYQSVLVNMSNQITGIYTLYVHVDDLVMSKNIIKK